MALVASVALTACGSTTTQASEPSATNVSSCDLLTTSTIKQVTGLALPAGKTAGKHQTGGWSICNWDDAKAGAAVQVQVHRGQGRADFDTRRQELIASGVGAPQNEKIAGADAAYDIAGQGVVGVLVGQDFVQITTIGRAFDTHEHLELAAAAVKELRK